MTTMTADLTLLRGRVEAKRLAAETGIEPRPEWEHAERDLEDALASQAAEPEAPTVDTEAERQRAAELAEQRRVEDERRAAEEEQLRIEAEVRRAEWQREEFKKAIGNHADTRRQLAFARVQLQEAQDEYAELPPDSLADLSRWNAFRSSGFAYHIWMQEKLSQPTGFQTYSAPCPPGFAVDPRPKIRRYFEVTERLNGARARVDYLEGALRGIEQQWPALADLRSEKDN